MRKMTSCSYHLKEIPCTSWGPAPGKGVLVDELSRRSYSCLPSMFLVCFLTSEIIFNIYNMEIEKKENQDGEKDLDKS